MRVIRKRAAREILIQAANGRLTKRRTAIRQLNGLLSKVSLDTFHLKPKNFNKDQLAWVLRLLTRRCVSHDQKTALRAACLLTDSPVLGLMPAFGQWAMIKAYVGSNPDPWTERSYIDQWHVPCKRRVQADSKETALRAAAGRTQSQFL